MSRMYNRTNGHCECGCGELAPIAERTYRKRGIIAGEPMRFVAQHQRRKSPAEYIITGDGCWIWQRALTRAGYGTLRVDGRTKYAHRVYYERHIGPIPDGAVLDHLCRTPACVNPAHLESVTQRTNMARGDAPGTSWQRKTHCKRGHPLTPDNIYRTGKGGRTCRTCALMRARERKRRLRAN